MRPVRAKRDLRDRRKGDRERRRVRQLLGEHKPCFGIPSARSVVPSELRHPRELAEDVHLLPGLEAGLGKGEAQEAHGRRKALRHPACAGEPAEGFGPDSTGLRGGDRFLEQDRRLLHVARVPAVLGGGDAASVDALERVWGRQRDRALGEVGRSLGGAARARMRRRRVERRRDLFVGAGRGDREMTGALLEIDVEFGEAAVKPAPSVQRHRLVAGGGEERMGEADPVAVELDHAPLLRELDVVDGRAPSDSSSVTEGAASAATATSVSRTRAGSAPNR